MANYKHYAAFDLGASGGRLMLGKWDGRVLTLEEIHRFANEPVLINGTLYWDAPRLLHEIKAGLKKTAGRPLRGIGIDTWGVDYGLLDARGQLLSLPIHYRDGRTVKFNERFKENWRGLYARTGIQDMSHNTLYQLQADAEIRPGVLGLARRLLFMPDLFTYFLTGEAVWEYTIASTSQLLNAVTKDWDAETFAKAGLDSARGLLGEITPPCTVVGGLLDEILAETGVNGDVKAVAVGGHDTASAVAGTPLVSVNGAYLSCGTWSLLGAELDEPRLTETSRELNFTNEGGLGGKIRYLKNINGLWLIQRLLASCGDKKMSFAELSNAAEAAGNANFVVEPNDPAFANPQNMYEAVREYCREHGQGEPESVGEAAAAVYNGLTREYANVIAGLETSLGAKVNTLHMVGGGIRDKYLCRLTAKTIGRPVLAGPVEASALGNVLGQMIGLGDIKNLTEGREIIRRSFKPEEYV